MIRSAKYARQEALDYVVELFEKQTTEALKRLDNYVYEGHFTNDATWDTPKKFREAGYRIHLLFFGLENTELSQFRVTERVTEGGHYVDPLTLEANFFGNLEKLNKFHELIDDLTIVDTSSVTHRVLFKKTAGSTELCLPIDELPNWFSKYLPSILKLILPR